MGLNMRPLILLIIDLGLVLAATLVALFLRENFEVTERRLEEFAPYLLVSLAMAAAIFPLAGLNRSVWRFSGLNDYLRVTAATGITVAGAVGLAFVYERLDGVARSLPLLQFITASAFLTGARALHRLAHDLRRRRKPHAAFLKPAAGGRLAKSVLIVGVSKLAEAYLKAVAELAPGQMKVVGLASRRARHIGRLVASYPVLGTPESLAAILGKLEVHGVAVDFIVVAVPMRNLSSEAREALLAAECARNIELIFLAEDWRLSDRPSDSSSSLPEEEAPALSFEISNAQLEGIARRHYWMVKRAADIVLAVFLLSLLSPLMLLTAFLVAASIGSPVIFWQQRPGLGGKPFRLYKFCTMRSAHGRDGRRLSDGERVSGIGKVLRRLRLDELPQLFNILRGDMSLIGPRPLLPQDQSEAYRARLLVRPGLTGVAQVIGGRDMAPVDKAALDVWYVCNASLALDIQIALRTVPFVLFGEKIRQRFVENAWRDLGALGVIR